MPTRQSTDLRDRHPDPRRRVDVRHGQKPRLRLASRVLDAIEVDASPDVGREGRHLCAVPPEEIDESIAEHAGADDESAVSRLHEIGRRKLHRERSRSCDDKRLTRRAQPRLAHGRERAAECIEKRRGEVTWGGFPQRGEYVGLEFDRAGNHQERTAFHLGLPFTMECLPSSTTLSADSNQRTQSALEVGTRGRTVSTSAPRRAGRSE